MNDDLYIGIDPGAKGGIAMIFGEGQVYDAFPLPMIGSLVNVESLAVSIGEAIEWKSLRYATIEKVHSMPGQGVASTFKFGKNYGMLIGMLFTLGIPTTFVTPQAWKKDILAGTAKDKAAACEFVVAKYPDVKLVQPRCRNPHDGVADAVCICEYGRLNT